MKFELPEKMKKLDLDKRGFPIPYIILIDDEGTPHFVINDGKKISRCLRLKLCAICGYPMAFRENGKIEKDMWLIGGPRSAFDPEGVYFDTPIHKECGRFSLEVCPYLSSRNYEKHLSSEKVTSRVRSKSLDLYVDNTMDPNRPKLFVFQKISGFNILAHNEGQYVIPHKPYLEIEYWTQGVRMLDYQAIDVLEELGLKKEMEGCI